VYESWNSRLARLDALLKPPSLAWLEDIGKLLSLARLENRLNSLSLAISMSSGGGCTSLTSGRWERMAG